MKSKVSSAAVCRAAALLLCVFLFPLCSLAQQNKLVVAPVDPVIIKQGGHARVTVKVTTLAGFHVNSNTPKEEFLIPLKLTWAPSSLKPGPVQYPAATDMKVGTDNLSVFTGTFPLITELTAPATAPTGSTTLTGNIHYQACNNLMCFRPSTIEVRVPVTVQ